MESPTSKEKDLTTLPQVDPTNFIPEANAIQSTQSDDKESTGPLNDEAPPEYLHGFKLFIVLVALLLSMFLVLLSLTEIALTRTLMIRLSGCFGHGRRLARQLLHNRF